MATIEPSHEYRRVIRASIGPHSPWQRPFCLPPLVSTAELLDAGVLAVFISPKWARSEVGSVAHALPPVFVG